MIRVTIWNENFHERMAEFDEKFRPYQEKVLAVHPNGLHNTLADLVRELGDEVTVRTATLDMPDAGLPQEVLDDTDVLLWWGHMAHDRVPDEVVDRVQQAVLNGMGLIVLHSAHHSKVFKRLMGTTCDICWRTHLNGSSAWSPLIPLPRACPVTSSWMWKSAMANALTSPNPTMWCSWPGTTLARCSAAAAPLPAAMAKSSISSPATRPIALIITKTCAPLSRTP